MASPDLRSRRAEPRLNPTLGSPAAHVPRGCHAMRSGGRPLRGRAVGGRGGVLDDRERPARPGALVRVLSTSGEAGPDSASSGPGLGSVLGQTEEAAEADVRGPGAW